MVLLVFGVIGICSYWFLVLLVLGFIGIWSYWYLVSLVFGLIGIWSYWYLVALVFGLIGVWSSWFLMYLLVDISVFCIFSHLLPLFLTLFSSFAFYFLIVLAICDICVCC